MGRQMVPDAKLSKVVVLAPDASRADMRIAPLAPHLVRPHIEAERHPIVSDHQPWWQPTPALAPLPDGDWEVWRARYAPHHLPALADHLL